MTQRFILLSLTAIIAVSLLGSAITLSRADDPTKSTTMPFDGKVLTVYEHGRDLAEAISIEDAEVIEIGGQKFLQGMSSSVSPDADWTHGLKVMFALDSIGTIITYDSVEEFNERMQFGEKAN